MALIRRIDGCCTDHRFGRHRLHLHGQLITRATDRFLSPNEQARQQEQIGLPEIHALLR
ncbi:hypothetical protein C8D83_102431 [Halothiobacillus neapolitanus]|nr:hypothetical protein C8D83_102431 [Halothiobacillus neapolitanus]